MKTSHLQLKKTFFSSSEILFGILIFFLSVSGIQAQTFYPDYEDGHIFFQIKADSSQVLNDFSGNPADLAPEFLPLHAKYAITKIDKPFAWYGGVTWTQKTYNLEFQDKDSVDFFITDLMALGYIEYAEKVPIAQLSFVPNDPLSNMSAIDNRNWHLKKIGAEEAWNITPTSSVTVAVIDNEIDLNHPDLTGRFVLPSDQADGDNVTTAPSGFSHGTHVAGLVAANTNNSNGVSSIAGNTSLIKIMPIKASPDAFFYTPNNLSPIAIINGILYATANGADIISMSIGMNASTPLQNALQTAVTNNKLIVAAAGNNNTNVFTNAYPAAYNQLFPNNIICVGATAECDEKASFSNYGSWVDVMAPGNNIYSTDNTQISNPTGGYYSYKSGTSMATPQVAGLCGLIKSVNNTLTPAQIKAIITSSVRNIYPVNAPIYASQLGTGRIDAYPALLLAQNTFVVNFSASENNACPGSPISLNAFAGPGVTINSLAWTFSSPVTYSAGNNIMPNIVITSATASVITVTLTANTSAGIVTIIKTNYLHFNGPVARLSSPAVNGLCNGSEQELNIEFAGGCGSYNYTISNTYETYSFATSGSSDVFYFVADPNHPIYTITSVTDGNGCSSTNAATISLTITNCCQNLITNGDFEAGNTGFSSDNVYTCTPTTTAPGLYTVRDYNLSLLPNTNICNGFGSWVVPFNNNTSHLRRNTSFAYDGPCGTNELTTAHNTTFNTPALNNAFENRAWFQTVTGITASTTYNIDFFTMNVASYNGFRFRLDILSGSTVVFTSGAYTLHGFSGWQQNSFFWPSGTTSGTVTVRLVQISNYAFFNFDLVVDDISLRKVNGTTGAAYAGPDLSICGGTNTTPLSGSGGPSYAWLPSATLSNAAIAQPVPTPTVTTTYTLTTVNAGCGTTTDQVTVSVITPTISVNPNAYTVAACGFLTLTTTTNIPNAAITIQPGNLSGNFVIPHINATTTFTVTATGSNGCIATATVTVNVTNNLTATASPTSLCMPTVATVTLSASSSSCSGCVYNWQPGALQAQNPVVSPTSTQTYTVYATDQFGCMQTQTVTVTLDPCCAAATYTISSNTTSHTFGAIASGSVVDITGTATNFTIDNNDVYTNVIFRIATNCRITVREQTWTNTSAANTLTLNNCRLYSCSGMWDGIYLGQTGTLAGGLTMQTGTSMEDAENGIVANSLSSNICSHIQISNCIFNKNFNNIQIRNFSDPLANLYNMQLKSTVLSCTASTTSPTNNLKSPHAAGVRTFVGVLTDNVTNIQIGITGAGLANSFSNMDYGIHATVSSIDVYNNNFTNMAGNTVTCGPQQCPFGVGVYVPNSAYNDRTINVGSTTANSVNSFSEIFRAVDVTYAGTLKVVNNNFNCTTTPATFTVTTNLTSNFGVRSRNLNSYLYVSGNTFTNFANAVGHRRNISFSTTTYNTQIDISNNIVNTAGSGYVTNAIAVSDDPANTLSTNPLGPVRMRDNTLTDISGTGIGCANIYNHPVVAGTVAGLQTINMRYAASGNVYGIYLNTCNKANVSNNTISSTTTGNQNMFGIYLLTTPKTLVRCNTLTSLGTCVRADGNCISPYTPATSYGQGIVTNTFTSSLCGISLVNGGNIGVQGDPTGTAHPAGNIWTNTVTSYTFGELRADGSSFPASSTYYYRNTIATETPGNLIFGWPAANTVGFAAGTPAGCPGPSSKYAMNGSEDDENSSENLVNVFPNPNNGVFEITIEQSIDFARLEVFDLQGKKIYSREVINFSREKIDLSSFSEGIYYVHLTGNGINEAKKIIKE